MFSAWANCSRVALKYCWNLSLSNSSLSTMRLIPRLLSLLQNTVTTTTCFVVTLPSSFCTHVTTTTAYHPRHLRIYMAALRTSSFPIFCNQSRPTYRCVAVGQRKCGITYTYMCVYNPWQCTVMTVSINAYRNRVLQMPHRNVSWHLRIEQTPHFCLQPPVLKNRRPNAARVTHAPYICNVHTIPVTRHPPTWFDVCTWL